MNNRFKKLQDKYLKKDKGEEKEKGKKSKSKVKKNDIFEEK